VSRPDYRAKPDDPYSFCESIHAGGATPWHIRKLDGAGRKLGGGITSKSLCTRVDRGWDLDVKITKHHLTHSCRDCVKAYLAEAGEPTT
jgi:hypothetical protein